MVAIFPSPVAKSKSRATDAAKKKAELEKRLQVCVFVHMCVCDMV